MHRALWDRTLTDRIIINRMIIMYTIRILLRSRKISLILPHRVQIRTTIITDSKTLAEDTFLRFFAYKNTAEPSTLPFMFVFGILFFLINGHILPVVVDVLYVVIVLKILEQQTHLLDSVLVLNGGVVCRYLFSLSGKYLVAHAFQCLS